MKKIFLHTRLYRARLQANIPMHVVAGLSQIVEKANSTCTDIQAHDSERARPNETVPMLEVAELPLENDEANSTWIENFVFDVGSNVDTPCKNQSQTATPGVSTSGTMNRNKQRSEKRKRTRSHAREKEKTKGKKMVCNMRRSPQQQMSTQQKQS